MASLHHDNMSCEEFQALMPELIGSGGDINLHPHMRGCPACTALLVDLETIAEAAHRLFRSVDPPLTLWSEIESVIMRNESSPKQM
jgi:hypothetical protein